MKNSSNVIPFNPTLKGKSRLTENDIYNACYDKWIKIKRACDNSKTIVHEAVFFIAALEFLFLKDEDEIIFSSNLLINKTTVKKKQRGRYLKQLTDLYHIEYHNKYIYKGKVKRCVFSAKRTENCLKILADPQLFYSQLSNITGGQKNNLELVNGNQEYYLELQKSPRQNDYLQGQKSPHIGSNLTSPYSSRLREIKEEDSPYRAISSSLQDTTRLGDTTHVYAHAREEIPISKPRIRVSAVSVKFQIQQEQSIASLSREAASSLCSTEQTKPEDAVKTKPRIKVTADFSIAKNNRNSKPLTSDQERDHYSNHRSRSIEFDNGFIPTADILTLANLLPTTDVKPTYIALPTNDNPQEEDTMKAYDWEDPAKKLDLAIVRNFDTAMAQELTTSIDYRYSESEHKMRLVLKQKLAISEHNKSRIKQLIRDIYGDDVAIVYIPLSSQKATVVKLLQTQEKIISTQQKNDNFTQKPLWQRAKNVLIEIHGKIAVDDWFAQIEITEGTEKIDFDTSDAFVHYITNNFQSALTKASKEVNRTLRFVGKSKVQAGKVDIIEITEKGVFNG